MKDRQKKFLHDIIAEILELPLNKVIWAYQNAMPRQKTPYVLIRLYGMEQEAQPEIRDTEVDDVKLIVTPQRINLEVQYFAGTTVKIDPSHELQKLVRGLENPEIVDKCFAEKIAVFDNSNVLDITDMFEGQVYEYRAVVELFVRFNSEYEVNTGAIEQVNINQTLSSDGDDSTSTIDGSTSTTGEKFVVGDKVNEPEQGVKKINALVHGKVNTNGTVDDYTGAVLFDLEIRGE